MNLKNQKTIFFFSLLFIFLFFAYAGVSSADGSVRKEAVFQKAGDFYLSQIIETDELFYALSFVMPEGAEDIYADFSFSGNWEPVETESEEEGLLPSGVIITKPTHFVRLKLKAGLSPEEGWRIPVDFFMYKEEAFAKKFEFETDGFFAGDTSDDSVSVIKRTSWGADESIRLWDPEVQEAYERGKDDGTRVPVDDSKGSCASYGAYESDYQIIRVKNSDARGNNYQWPLQYVRSIGKLVIHHTGTESRDINGDSRTDSRDYAAILEAIYNYHAVTLGWGDIGYNYIIDPLGNIYQGRYGGDNVVGGHVLCHNSGSLGIAVIGNYDKQEISRPAMNSLVKLLALKAKQHGIKPLGSSEFRGVETANILGHRDLRATACPGKNLYAKLPDIKNKVDLLYRSGSFDESNISAVTKDYDAQALSGDDIVSLLPKHRKKVILKYKNTGNKTWDSNTWLHVSLNNKDYARVVSVIPGKSFVAADMKESSVRPGGTATFEVEFEADYIPVRYRFEVAPVVNGRFRISHSAMYIPVEVEKPEFGYQIVSEDLPSDTVFQGQHITASVKLKNTGNATWQNYGNNPIRLGTEETRDRRSLLVRRHTSRVAHLLESEVEPGETGTFVFDLYVPEDHLGVIKERFTPVIEGVEWLEDKGMGLTVTVKKPRHMAKITEKTHVSELQPGERKRVELTLQNIGDLVWDQNNMKINILSRGIKVFKRAMKPLTTVEPKETEEFSFWAEAPYDEGRHTIFLNSRFNNVRIQGGAVRYVVNVERPFIRAQKISQLDKDVVVRPGQEKTLEVKYRNIGNTVWQKNGENAIHLGTARPNDRRSDLYYEEEWDSPFRAAEMNEDYAGPGETATFYVKIKPEKKGIFKEYFQLVIEGVEWVPGTFVRWDIQVKGDVFESTTSSRAYQVNKERAAAIASAKSSAELKDDYELPITNYELKTENDNPKSEDNLRVRISYGDDNSRISADNNFYVRDGNGKELFYVGAGTYVSIRRAGDNFHVQLGNISKSASIVRIEPEEEGIVEIISMERRPSWNQSLNDNKFRGVMEVRNVNGKTAFINELPLEDYMRGLAEATNDTPYEKMKALAVLARSYAKFYMSEENRKFPGLPYDGSDDPDVFQKYLGYGYELRSPNFLSAVEATRGQVVMYNGKLVKTPYFSQSDGRTRSAEEIFGWKNTPYLVSVDDPYCVGLELKGHGVGLSGCGAEGMANAGKKYNEIIKYYYKDVSITNFPSFRDKTE